MLAATRRPASRITSDIGSTGRGLSRAGSPRPQHRVTGDGAAGRALAPVMSERGRMPKGKPNIVVFWGDDIGITNLSCYSDGLMGYRTNIDRLADEGMRFTDSYGEQSCTAGRSAFITGQSVYRTGLSKVGLPGRSGLQAEDPTIAEPEAARLRDRAVRQEPPRRPRRAPADGARLRRVLRQPLPPERRGGAEHPDYPDPEHYPEFRERYGPRGVLHSKMTSGGRHTIKDTGPLDEEADGDDRRRDRGRRDRLHPAQAQRTNALLRLDQHHAHALPDAHQAPEPRAGTAAGSPRTTTR